MENRSSAPPATNYQPLTTVYVVGPTASGKSALAIRLAHLLDAEIVCADSQTVRKGMDIGTAKPTLEEREGVVHHCLDMIGPYDEFSLDEYLRQAREVIADVHTRGKRALVVGGSGLYVDGLYYNFELPELSVETMQQKETLNKLSVEELQELVLKQGLQSPENQLNKRHLVNTLLRNGTLGVRGEPEASSVIVGLNPLRELLLERINARTDAMIAAGFFDEVKQLLQTYGEPPREFDAIAYRIAMRHLNGEITGEQTAELMKIADRQYAKRQLSWFKRNQNIVWFEDGITAYEYVRALFL